MRQERSAKEARDRKHLAIFRTVGSYCALGSLLVFLQCCHFTQITHDGLKVRYHLQNPTEVQLAQDGSIAIKIDVVKGSGLRWNRDLRPARVSPKKTHWTKTRYLAGGAPDLRILVRRRRNHFRFHTGEMPGTITVLVERGALSNIMKIPQNTAFPFGGHFIGWSIVPPLDPDFDAELGPPPWPADSDVKTYSPDHVPYRYLDGQYDLRFEFRNLFWEEGIDLWPGGLLYPVALVADVVTSPFQAVWIVFWTLNPPSW